MNFTLINLHPRKINSNNISGQEGQRTPLKIQGRKTENLSDNIKKLSKNEDSISTAQSAKAVSVPPAGVAGDGDGNGSGASSKTKVPIGQQLHALQVDDEFVLVDYIGECAILTAVGFVCVGSANQCISFHLFYHLIINISDKKLDLKYPETSFRTHQNLYLILRRHEFFLSF